MTVVFLILIGTMAAKQYSTYNSGKTKDQSATTTDDRTFLVHPLPTSSASGTNHRATSRQYRQLRVFCSLFSRLFFQQYALRHTEYNRTVTPSSMAGIHTTRLDSVTMTIKVDTNGATTLSRINFSGYVGHVTTTFTIACCLVVGPGLVSGW